MFDRPALFAIDATEGAADQMYPQLNVFAQADSAHFLFVDQKGSLFAVMYNFLQIAHF